LSTASLFRAPNGEKQVIIPGSYLVEGGKERWTVRGLSWHINVTAIVDSDIIYATPAIAAGRL
jgi:hypothetical protein